MGVLVLLLWFALVSLRPVGSTRWRRGEVMATVWARWPRSGAGKRRESAPEINYLKGVLVCGAFRAVSASQVHALLVCRKVSQ